VIGEDAVFASNTSTLPITGLAQAAPPCALHRPALLLARGQDAAGRDHRGRENLGRHWRAVSTTCCRSARRPSWSTTAGASTPPRVRHLRDGGHRHAGRGRAPRADRWRASRPACPCRRWPCRTRCR
jgi:hypothetical protein